MTPRKIWNQKRPKIDNLYPKALLTLPPIFGLIRLPFHGILGFLFMYAVFETGGKQYRASAGDLVKVEMLGSENGSTVTFDRVLLVNNDGKVTIGNPTVDNASVTAEVIDSERKDKKLIIFKMKRRKTYRLKKGHRQRHSIVKITDIKA